SSTRAKTTTFATDREIRMIYKLTEEVPDAEVRHIAKLTFYFQQQNAADVNNRTFETIPRPWDQLDTDYTSRSTAATDNFAPGGQIAWASRTRSGNRAAYLTRNTNDVPLWVRELIVFKETCKSAANTT